MLKETHLKMKEKLLDIGWKMGSTRLEPVSLTVPPLLELTQWHTSCVSPANALVIVLVLQSAALCFLPVQREQYKIWASNTCSDSCSKQRLCQE